MSVWDGRILELATQDDDGIVSVGDLDDNEYIRVTKSNISTRCSKLADHGLLRKVGHGVYAITAEGRAYLDGEYDADAEAYINDDEATEPTASETGTNGV